MAETLTELVARITADATELKKALNESEKGMKDLGKKTDKEVKSISDSFRVMGKSIGVIGATITASMGMIMKSFTSTGDELVHLSEKTGFSIKTLGGLKYAAEAGGASLGTIDMAMRGMASAMEEAKDKGNETTDLFRKLGLTLSEFEGLKPEEQFIKLAMAVANVEDPIQRIKMAQEAFGRSGKELIPVIAGGADEFQRMIDRGIELAGWTGENANKAHDFDIALLTVKTSMSGIYNVIGEQLAPSLTNLADNFTNIASATKNWAKENEGLIGSLAGGAEIMGGFGVFIGGVSLVLPGLATAAKAAGLALLPFIGLLSLLSAGLGLVGIGLAEKAKWDNYNTQATKLNAQATEEYNKLLASQPNTYALVLEKQLDLYESLGNLDDKTKSNIVSIRQWIADWKELVENTEAGSNVMAEGLEKVTNAIFKAGQWVFDWNKLWKGYTGGGGGGAGGWTSMPGTGKVVPSGTPGSYKGAAPGESGLAHTFGIEGEPTPTVGIEGEPTPTGGNLWLEAELAQFQHGGIVTKPTLSLIGEAGPEAVIPLNKMGEVHVHLEGNMFLGNESEARKFADLIRKYLRQDERFQYGGAIA